MVIDNSNNNNNNDNGDGDGNTNTGGNPPTAACVDAYDDGTVAKPWPDFVSCAAEKAYCQDQPATLLVHCAKTCGTCTPERQPDRVLVRAHGDRRSGGPNEVNTFEYHAGVTVNANELITLTYKFVAGYCQHGKSNVGAEFEVLIGGVAVPGMRSKQHGGTTAADFPYDSNCGGCPDCYSPWIELESQLLEQPMSGKLEIRFTNNGRNMHLVLDSIAAGAK